MYQNSGDFAPKFWPILVVQRIRIQGSLLFCDINNYEYYFRIYSKKSYLSILFNIFIIYIYIYILIYIYSSYIYIYILIYIYAWSKNSYFGPCTAVNRGPFWFKILAHVPRKSWYFSQNYGKWYIASTI